MLAREPGPRLSPRNADRFLRPSGSPYLTSSVAYTIGWLFVISGVLAVLAVSFFPRYGYSITTAGLLLAFAGLLIAGHTWAAVVVFVLTLARYGYYLYLRNKVRLVRSWR
jgi:hypothetical protein